MDSELMALADYLRLGLQLNKLIGCHGKALL